MDLAPSCMFGHYAMQQEMVMYLSVYMNFGVSFTYIYKYIYIYMVNNPILYH